MSGLAYDLELLEVLRRRLRAASALLHDLRSPDPLADDAVAAVLAARSRLEHQLLPLVTRVLLDDPLGTASPASLPGAFGPWSPDAMVAGVIAGATAVAPDEVWIATFEALAAERLDVQQQLLDAPDDPELLARRDELDRRIADAAAAYAAGAEATGDGHVRWYPTALLDMSPYAAALVLAHLGPDVLDDRAFGAVASLVVRRWADGREGAGERWDDFWLGGDNTSDLVFRALAERPAAATVFLQRARPDDVLRTAQFGDSVAALLLAGTDPAHVDETTAGAVLRPLLQQLQTRELPAAVDGVATGLAAVLAVAVTPWLADLGPRAGAWDWSYDEGDATLRFLLDDPEALAALTRAIDDGRRVLTTTGWFDSDGRLDDTALHQLAVSFAQVQVAVRDAEIDDAIAAQLMNRLSLEVAGIAISAVVPGGPIASASADTALALLTPQAAGALDRWGLAPSDDRIRAEAGARFGDRVVDTTVIALTGVAGAAIERGDLPADALDRLDDALTADGQHGDCAARDVSERLQQWVHEVSADADPSTAHALLAVLYAFDDPLAVAQLCE
ncbi:MAG: hypothetical protein U0Q03_03800 [Acidimicrobiales bacterium]